LGEDFGGVLADGQAEHGDAHLLGRETDRPL
jgi:hypothetical protein